MVFLHEGGIFLLLLIEELPQLLCEVMLLPLLLQECLRLLHHLELALESVLLDLSSAGSAGPVSRHVQVEDASGGHDLRQLQELISSQDLT